MDLILEIPEESKSDLVNNIIIDAIDEKYPLQITCLLKGDLMDCWIYGSSLHYNIKTKKISFPNSSDPPAFHLVRESNINTYLLDSLYKQINKRKEEKESECKTKEPSKKEQEILKKYADSFKSKSNK